MMHRRNFLLASSLLPLAACSHSSAVKKAAVKTGLASVFADDFLIGTAVSTSTLMESDLKDLALIQHEFNSITAENCQKWEEINPTLDQWNWEASDRFVKFAVDNQKHILGHTLVWHSQIPETVFKDNAGQWVTASLLKGRMEEHINTLVDRYKGKIHAWDVVNEIVSDNGNNDWRKSPWFNIMGKEFFEHAFKTAHAADPAAELIYNDYNMHHPAKLEFLKGVIGDCLDRGVPIQSVGFQAHYMLTDPEIEQIERAMETYSAMGLKIHFSELDIDVLPQAMDYMGAEISTSFEYSDQLNPYPDGLPEAIEEQLAERYAKLFKLFVKHRDVVQRVTTWGTTDSHSWKNNWPVKGRTNYPLLFNRQGKPKKAYYEIQKIKTT